ncbi:MAG: tryptophan 7-halogenase, partial [Bacteroidota bacterium]|nr:tryptophan 7-halogenase [Bacteroidota bacterium]
MWDDVRDFLAVHYRFNRKIDTPFWKHCREATDLGAAQCL